MSTFGNVTKRNVSAVDFLDNREIFKQIIDITNEKASFARMMNIMGRYEITTQPNYHNFVNTELFSTETITNPAVTTHTANTDITVRVSTADGASFFRVNEIVQIPGANRRTARVVAKTADASGDLIRLQSISGLAMELANGQVLSVTGSTNSEGGTFVEHRKHFPTKRMNNVQEFAEVIAKITDIQNAAKLEVSPDSYLYFDEANGLLTMEKNISNQFLFGEGTGDNFTSASPTHVDSSGRPISTTRGLNSHIAAEGQTFNGVTIGETVLNNLKRQYAKKRTPMEFLMLGGAEMAIQNSQYWFNLPGGAGGVSDSARWMTGDDTTIGIEGWKYNGMKFKVTEMAAFDEQAITNFTGSAGYQNFVFILPTANVPLVGGGSAPGIRVRYMSVPGGNGANSSSNGIYRTTKLGNLAENPTSDVRELAVNCHTIQGLECLNAPHCSRLILQSSGS
jgi:hypothetical protein